MHRRYTANGPAAALLGLFGVFGGALLLTWMLFRRRLLSASADMSHHGQLVDALAANGQTLPASLLSYMPAGMYTYPNLAHRIAALFVAGGLDTVRAMNALAMASALFVWIVLFDLTRRASRPAFFAAVILAVGLARFCFAMFGGEVVGNFFFAQLVGEAAFVVCAVSISTVAARPIVFALAAAAAVYLCSNVHLMLAVKLAGVALALWAVQLAGLWAQRRVDWRQALAPVLVPLTLVLSPQFKLMRVIAGNNGDIGFGARITVDGTGLLAFVLLLASGLPLLARLVRAVRSRGNGGEAGATRVTPSVVAPETLLFAIGAATAAAALAQYLLLRLGHDGNDYAVRKWLFGVLSMLILVGPLALARLARRGRDAESEPTGARSWAWRGAAVASGLLVVVVLFDRPAQIDVVPFVGLTRDTVALRAALNISNGGEAVFASTVLPPGEALYNTVVALREPEDAAVDQLLHHGAPDHLEAYRFVLAPRGDPQLDIAKCRIGAGRERVVVLSGPCLTKARPPAGIAPGIPVVFRRGDRSAAFLITGWSEPEPDHVWSQAREMEVKAPLVPGWAPSGPLNLTVSTYGFVAPPMSPTRTVRLSVDGAKPVAFTYTLNDRTHDFVLPLDGAALAAAGGIDLRFSVADPMAPSRIGMGGDTRELGIALTGMSIAPRR